MGGRATWDEASEKVSLPKDRLGYVRRECPSCHRQFKVRATELEGGLVLQRIAEQVSHDNGHEGDPELTMRACPYCGHHARDDFWFTAEQRAWIDKRAESYSQELRYEQLAHVERTLSVNPNPTFMPVRPQQFTATLRTEPDDMRVVPLLCCGDSLKISETWLGPLHCFYCGVEHDYGESLVRQRLAGIFE